MAALDGADVRITSALRLRYPIRCVAPMVGQCDGPFRSLCRRHGATLVYTEMLEAARFARGDAHARDALGGGVDAGDRPLVVQFCANEPAAFAAACARARALGADGADLNLGCPQLREEGRYGAWLQEDWALCRAMVAAAAAAVPETFAVTVKLRVQYDAAGAAPRTVAFARELVAAGARLVALHARTRGRVDARRDGAADLAVRRLVAGLGVPVLSNGNVRSSADVAANLAATGAAGVMVAEQLLRDPSLGPPRR
ncbi:tRNA dihydrouridine synthase [Aureococcus anophagefferens]|nr:tRNA dihydrouridine synthase [Aureococcus anophagefferens]